MNQERFDNIKEALYQYSASAFSTNILNYVTFEELLKISIAEQRDARLAFKATWFIEHIVSQNHDLLLNNCHQLLHNFTISTHWSCLRSFSKIIIILFTEAPNAIYDIEAEEDVINKSFNILNNIDCPIAVRCNIYDILFQLSTKQKWIAKELAIQINFDLEKSPSAALISRGKRILKKLEII